MSGREKVVHGALWFWRTVFLPVWGSIARITPRSPSTWIDPSEDPVRHIFVLMLENRSFDQVLGAFKDDGEYAALEGIDAKRLYSNFDGAGNKYVQAPSEDDRAPFDPDHEFPGVAEQLADDHAGFVRNFEETHPLATREQRQCVMNYFPKGSLAAMHWLAENFTICDHWFSSVPGPTWTNRLFLMSGTSMGRTEMGSRENPDGFLGYDQRSIFDLLEDKGIPWRIYFHDFPQSWLLHRQLLQRRKFDNYRPLSDTEGNNLFEADLKNEGANFPRFCFIEPQYFEPGQNDDHPTSSAAAAQALIARVYNAIRSQEDVWKSSLLLVLYDEHGGFFDHVPPPKAVAPAVPKDYTFKDKGAPCPFTSLGVRVPAVLVSPWVEKGVFQETLDHTSLLKYACKKWKLPFLTSRVEQANDFGRAIHFPFRKVPDTRIEVPFRAEMRAQASAPGESLLSNHQEALRGLCARIEAEIPPLSQELPRAKGDIGAMQLQAPQGDSSNEMRSRTFAILAARGASQSDNGPSAGQADPK